MVSIYRFGSCSGGAMPSMTNGMQCASVFYSQTGLPDGDAGGLKTIFQHPLRFLRGISAHPWRIGCVGCRRIPACRCMEVGYAEPVARSVRLNEQAVQAPGSPGPPASLRLNTRSRPPSIYYCHCGSRQSHQIGVNESQIADNSAAEPHIDRRCCPVESERYRASVLHGACYSPFRCKCTPI